MEPTEMNNQEEQYGQQPEVQAEPVASTESVAEPEDLAEAFKALREQNASSADKPVETSESAPEPEPVQSPVEQPIDYSYGEPANNVPRTNWSAKDAEAKRGIQQAAIQRVNEQWRQQGKRPIEMDELTRRDEQTGRLYYIDIYDDPKEWDQPGYRGTDKATARQHMKEFNEDLQAAWNKEVIQAQRDMAQMIEPIRRLYAFGPTYDSLDEETKDVLNELSEPYQIVDKEGRSWGFNVDLNMLLKQAQNIVAKTRSRYGSYQQPAPVQQKPQVRQPVVDSRSSAGESRQSNQQAEPKDIGDAIAMFERMQREQRKAR